jgi:hypothetical protein
LPGGQHEVHIRNRRFEAVSDLVGAPVGPEEVSFAELAFVPCSAGVNAAQTAGLNQA